MKLERARFGLIPLHGGYRNLKSFQLAQLVYDVTVRFSDRYLDRPSHTHDQTVPVAQSGVMHLTEPGVAARPERFYRLEVLR